MDFPNLQSGQHAVGAAEVQTGIFLSLDGKWWRKDQPAERWRVFDSFAAAREFAVAEVAKNPLVEFWIYDKKDHPVERIAR
jgi:hypothetical protein